MSYDSNATKIMSLDRLASLIEDGSSVAFGGSFLHRGPFALVRALVRRDARDLEVIKPSPGYDLDLLGRAGVAKRARAGIVAMEAGFGLAQGYRRAIETGNLALEEHACMTLVAGLRAAAYGVPFQPVAGVFGSDLSQLNGWQTVQDPYGSGNEVYVIPAIRPDIAVIHANEIDRLGNARVYGSPHWDRVMTRAARRVLITAEKLVSTERLREQPELTLVPGFLVTAAAVIPRGGWPGSVHPDYGIDRDAISAYMLDQPNALRLHLEAAPEVRELEHV